MKTLFTSILFLTIFSLVLSAGQSALNTTYQPLKNPANEEIWIVPVTCHHWYCNSSSSSVDLIGVKNVPPSDKPDQAKQDLNLASICGIRFSTCDLGASKVVPEVTMDISQLHIPKNYTDERTEIIRSCLECLRLCLPELVAMTPVTIEGIDKDKEWIAVIVKEFNAHDRSKPFYAPGSPAFMQQILTIKIPLIDAKDATLIELIGFIARRTVELDPIQPGGISMLSTGFEGKDGETKVDYFAKDVTLEKVYMDLARLFQVEFHVTSVGVVITPVGVQPFPNAKAKMGEVFYTYKSKSAKQAVVPNE
jgi:hypothetical protein